MAVTKRTWITSKGNPREAWVVRYYDAEGKYRIKTFKRERDAKAWEAQAKVDLKNGTHRPESTSLTIREEGDLWIANCKAEGPEPSALRQYEQHLRMHIVTATAPKEIPNGWPGKLGDLKICRLTSPMCEAFKLVVLKTNTRTRTGKLIPDKTISRTTAGHIVTSFKTMLNHAQTNGAIPYNPALPVKIKSRDRERVRLRIGVHIPDRPDVRSILMASTGMWHTLFMTDSFTGMRSSELRSLSWPNVHLEQNAIEVLNRADENDEIGAVKTGGSLRTIQIGDDLVEELAHWKRVCPASALELVFPDDEGEVLSGSAILRQLKALQVTAGLVGPDGKGKYTVHGLRHFYASLMIDQGTPPKRLQELLGHSTLAMTMDRYGHLFPAGSDEVTRINMAMASVLAA